MWHVSWYHSIGELKLITNKFNNNHQLNNANSQATCVSIKILVLLLGYLTLSEI